MTVLHRCKRRMTTTMRIWCTKRFTERSVSSVRHCTLQPVVFLYKIHSDWQTCHTVLIRSLDEPMSHPCVICLRVTQQAHGNCESLIYARRRNLLQIFRSAFIQATRISDITYAKNLLQIFRSGSSGTHPRLARPALLAVRIYCYVCTMHIYLRACRPRAFHERRFAWN